MSEKFLTGLKDIEWFYILRLLARDLCEDTLKKDGDFEEEMPYEFNGVLGIMIKTKSGGSMAFGKNDLIKKFAVKNNELWRMRL